jgi:hypothetical protein
VKISTRDLHFVPFSSTEFHENPKFHENPEFHENPLRKVSTLFMGINDFILINSILIDRFR